MGGTKAKAQDKASELASKIAQRMKDSLSLDETQRAKLYDLNMLLHNRKMSIRQQYAGKDSLSYYMQIVENSRDSLYHGVLTDEKYLLYKSKKRHLINNN